MKHNLMALLALCLPLTSTAQQGERPNSAISRNLEIFNDIYKQLDLFYVDSLNADTVIGWGIRSMLQQVDPFTDYYPEDDEELRQMATGKYAGIGSIVRFHKKEDRVVISEPYEGSPSMKAGVRAGDVILSIDGKDVKGMPTPKVSSMLRGEAGTTFELRVKRMGVDAPVTMRITRETIQMPQVPYYGMVAPGVGFIYLTGFTDGACREVRQALLDLKKQGAERLILDLRDNPGGALNEAVDIVNLFVPKGRKVMFTKGKLASVNRDYYTASEPVDTLMPLVVLADGGSASSSEIVCGSLQDMDRAVIVGSRTYGKGLVQAIREVPYHGNLKLTTSRYYIPSGRCIQAYDYRHLNPDGSVGTVPDSLTHVFHTANGREVRDGGGIKPDIEVKPDSFPSMIYDLVGSDEFFDYATLYASQHATIAPAGEFSMSDDDYAQFVDYICQSGFTYNRRSDEVLRMLKNVARREGYYETAQAEFAALEARFANDLGADLRRFRHDIEPYLCDEIVHRYYYEAGGVKQQLVGDPSMKQALELLQAPERYAAILKGSQP
ncbi:MAG: S41 family peptidase [Bacteroidaceae bacterium]|nr:S41 family peptidase [Bacteroidaceae bacterium]